MAKVFVGHDWAEAHHDVHIEDETGRRLAVARLPEGVEGVRRFHELTRASGKQRVVLARWVRNRHLADTCHAWAFAAISASPGARAFYDQRRANGDTHNRALRALANRLVGILHGCLRHGTLYDEHTAWKHRTAAAA